MQLLEDKNRAEAHLGEKASGDRSGDFPAESGRCGIQHREICFSHRALAHQRSLSVRRCLAALVLALIPLLAGCNAEPNATDVNRVKDEFLHLRFQSQIQPELKGLSDARLLQMACKRNNVQCDLVIERLKESDPEFYKVLEPELNRD
ncbi:MAG: hypothetical protein CMF59_06380 [Leptospiraceae bacterium]|nr:hypothetical protein [Leptospiraceae bacterium]